MRRWAVRTPRNRRRRWTLRTRLLAALLALLASVSLAVGLVSVVTQQHYLLGQLDQQLASAGGRSSNAEREPPAGGHGGAGPDFLLTPGQAAGTLGARITDGRVSAAVLDSTGSPRAVPSGDNQTLSDLPVGDSPRDVSLAGLGRYRVLVTRSADGDVIVTGLPLSGIESAVYRLAVVVAVVAFAGLVLAALAASLIVRLALRPLSRVVVTATRVSELPLDRGEVSLDMRVPAADTDPRTEVGQVGTAFNRMLGHVATALAARQASETRVRQFVADASHELRTPLAAIRGYAELTRRSGQGTPSDVAHALGRIEAESVRMSILVDDLLLLARLDSGRPVRREPVDLVALVVDAASDAHAAGPDYPIRLELPAEPVLVSGDAARLHQVVAGILSNARTHTPTGTAITVGLAAEGDEALIRVADAGPGIPADLLPRVFERFARADTSRSRAAGSTGLGLAIVEAVVAAHGGRVEVTSRPGETVFTVGLRRDVPMEARGDLAPGSS